MTIRKAVLFGYHRFDIGERRALKYRRKPKMGGVARKAEKRYTDKLIGEFDN